MDGAKTCLIILSWHGDIVSKFGSYVDTRSAIGVGQYTKINIG